MDCVVPGASAGAGRADVAAACIGAGAIGLAAGMGAAACFSIGLSGTSGTSTPSWTGAEVVFAASGRAVVVPGLALMAAALATLISPTGVTGLIDAPCPAASAGACSARASAGATIGAAGFCAIAADAGDAITCGETATTATVCRGVDGGIEGGDAVADDDTAANRGIAAIGSFAMPSRAVAVGESGASVPPVTSESGAVGDGGVATEDVLARRAPAGLAAMTGADAGRGEVGGAAVTAGTAAIGFAAAISVLVRDGLADGVTTVSPGEAGVLAVALGKANAVLVGGCGSWLAGLIAASVAESASGALASI